MSVNIQFPDLGLPSPSKSLPPFRSDLGSAAVNEQFDTRDETGVIRSQKQSRLSNFLGFPHASHRDGATQSAQSRLQIADSPVAY